MVAASSSSSPPSTTQPQLHKHAVAYKPRTACQLSGVAALIVALGQQMMSAAGRKWVPRRIPEANRSSWILHTHLAVCDLYDLDRTRTFARVASVSSIYYIHVSPGGICIICVICICSPGGICMICVICLIYTYFAGRIYDLRDLDHICPEGSV